tara:strand:+ start:136 stop:549 length:414 start_codon:yes stop_codon:yes gene_type:complete
MPLEIKQIADGDYENILTKWWSDWGWISPSKDFLPQDGLGGIMVYDEDEPICAGFVYMTNSSVAWVDWIVSNKHYRKKPHRKEAIELLINTLTDFCKKRGAKYVFSNNNNSFLIEHFKKQGYVVGSENSTELIKTWE